MEIKQITAVCTDNKTIGAVNKWKFTCEQTIIGILLRIMITFALDWLLNIIYIKVWNNENLKWKKKYINYEHMKHT